MVKKIIKVVDVDVAQNEEVTQPIVEVVPMAEEIKDEEVQPIQDDKQNEIKPNEQIVKQTSSAKTTTCEFCNKEMLMKTYKYNHKLQCQGKHKPPPPPPPPSPEPKKKAQRESKPKAKKEEAPKVIENTSKPIFNGLVSFNDAPRVDPYAALRKERLMMQQQRVKSLISQAL